MNVNEHKQTQPGQTCEAGFVPVSRSLEDLLGGEYVGMVCQARAWLSGEAEGELATLGRERVDFFPAAMRDRLASLLPQVGRQVVEPALLNTPAGAGSATFQAATNLDAAPLNGFGYYRLGEDGRLYLITKSEHYHAPLGHAFPGYGLVDHARRLGIPNATHNNTRGFITRRLEQELVRTANGLERGDDAGLAAVLSRQNDLGVLNRVLNLETGSLAVEAALKLVLARFYRMQPDQPRPPYAGRLPVILVMGNDDGELPANYHGTTLLTQMLRGMWPEAQAKLAAAGLWRVVPIRPNCLDDLRRAFAEYEGGDHKIAGFFHEIIMMNYGGRRLEPEFLRAAHALCEAHDVPTMVDEIQSCMWATNLFLFRDYGLRPSMVAVGKGFPGGEYPASRILFSAALDTMPQFGALVTNGQEELASLAYLVTMEWAQANQAATAALGNYFEERLHAMAGQFPQIVEAIDGWRQMTTLRFAKLAQARAFVHQLNQRGLDVSAQTYKADCPPVVLTKMPLIADRAMLDFTVEAMREALGNLNT